MSALALVIGHSGDLDDSVQLAALLSCRLSSVSPTIDVIPRIGGVTLVAAVTSDQAARALVNQIDAVVRLKVAPAETAEPKFQRTVLGIRSRLSVQGLLLQNWCQQRKTPSTSISSASLENLRIAAFTEAHAKWSVVGETSVVDVVEETIKGLGPWPTGTSDEHIWPLRDESVLLDTQQLRPRIDVTWRATSASTAMWASRDSTGPSSELGDAVGSLPRPMRIARYVVTPMESGACVSISLMPDNPGVPMTFDGAVSATRLTVDRLRRIVQNSELRDAGLLSVVEQEDPRKAAELAGLFALSTDSGKRPDRFHVAVDLGVGTALTKAPPVQQRSLQRLLKSASALESLPLSQSLELGQGSIYALLASPCGGWGETGKSVGGMGLMLRSLAFRPGGPRDVVIEPWVNGNGTGLIASTRRLSANESSEQQASRLGEALGRVLVASRLEPGDLWRSRNDLLVRLGPGPRPALWQTIFALSPQYPALVAPDGTPSSIEAISIEELLERRTKFLRDPLRLAVVANGNDQQGAVVRRALARWLGPLREESSECPVLSAEDSQRARDIRIENRPPDSLDAPVLLSVVLPTTGPGDETHAALLLWLLQRSNGWFESRMREAGTVSTVDARVVGGQHRRGLIVAIGSPPSTIELATATVRTLFEELGDQKLPQPSAVAEGIEYLRHAADLRRMDPRARLEDLWLSRRQSERVSDTTFRNFLRRTFGSSTSMTIVRTESTPTAGQPSIRTKR